MERFKCGNGERYGKDHAGCYVENRPDKGQHECRVHNHRRDDTISDKGEAVETMRSWLITVVYVKPTALGKGMDGGYANKKHIQNES